MKKFIVFLAAFAMVLGFTAKAMADATLYGSARFDTFWHDYDEEIADQSDLDDDEDLEWQMGKLSRFGVNFKQGDITGKFEIDARAGSITTGTNMRIEDDSGSSYHGNMRLRHLWGAWNFGAGELCIGHRHSLYTYYVSQFGNDAGAGLAHFGGYNLRYFRASQIRLTFGNLKIAFLTPDTSYKPIDPITGNETVPIDTDTELPRIEVAYTLNLEPVTLDFMGGWQSFEVTLPTGNDEDVDSFVGLVKATANFGPLYLKGLVRYAQNGGNYGIWSVCEEKAALNGDDVEDAEAWGYGLAIGYKVSDMITLEAAIAGTDAENDDLPGKPEDDCTAYGMLCKITPAPGVTIQPEILLIDQGDTDNVYDQPTYHPGDEQGEELRIGVFWKIDFK
jgi:hypothetical protein